MQHQFSIEYAKSLDEKDPLHHFRNQFIAPIFRGKRAVYFLGNSLGLQPVGTQEALMNVMNSWASLGVEGFFLGSDPWIDYHKKNSSVDQQDCWCIAGRSGNHEPSYGKPAPADDLILHPDSTTI